MEVISGNHGRPPRLTLMRFAEDSIYSQAKLHFLCDYLCFPYGSLPATISTHSLPST